MTQKVWIYAIRLNDAVLDSPQFRKRNPGHTAGKPCYYVGSSIYPPKKRFEMHKAGRKASRWVKRYGQHPALRKCYQIEAADSAERDASERAYAEELRARGYGVWQN